MKKYKYIFEVVVFFLLLSMLIGKYYDAVRYKHGGSGGGVENYYTTTVPIDVVAFGSSHAGCTVNNALLWDEYGMATYTLSAGYQTVDGIYYFMKESFRNNKPKVALVETYTFMENNYSIESFYRTVLATRWSFDYAKFAIKWASDNGYDHTYIEELLLKLPIVHTRYKELEREDFYNDRFYFKGYQGSDETSEIIKPVKTEARSPISSQNLYYMEKMVELCNKEGVQLIFFNAPYEASEKEVEIQNSVMDFANEHNVPYIGFIQNDDEYGIDYTSDFREYSHLNDKGANKVTSILAKYIKTNYEIPDRRGNPDYKDWDTHSLFVSERQDLYYLAKQESIAEYLKALSAISSKYTIVVSLDGNYNALGEEAYSSGLEYLGIDRESYLSGGLWVIRGGKIVYYSNGSESFKYHDYMMYDADLSIYKSETESYCHVIINENDCSHDTNGLSIRVYSEECMYLLNDIYLNIYDGMDIIRTDY